MRSKEQEIEMLEKLSKILRELPTAKSIKDISQKTNIPTSTVQRYLNKKDLITEFLEVNKSNENYEQINEEIKEKLSTYKSEGHRRGGQISQEKYGYSKGEAGKFTGNRKNK